MAWEGDLSSSCRAQQLGCGLSREASQAVLDICPTGTNEWVLFSAAKLVVMCHMAAESLRIKQKPKQGAMSLS